ncbi:MAG: DUF4263 domain-containing protein [Gammaproteobacteria bacterium]|nr:DUF4263 domain-containing protein [Gammaproteobacteria bacterium]
MVINIRSYDPIRYGRMEVEKISNNLSDVYFLPPDHSIKKAGFDPSKTHIHRAKLLEINCQDRSLAIFPIKTYGYRDDFLQPKYRKIKRIILEDEWIIYPDMIDSAPTTADDILEILENLPQAFTKDYAFGLGLAKPYRFIIDAVEKLTNCTEIAITDKNETGLAQNEKCFYISKKDFHDARRSMNNIGNLAQVAVRTVRGTTAYNILANRIGVDTVEPKVGRHPYRKLFTKITQGKEGLSKDEQLVILQTLSTHVFELAEDKPEKLVKLRGDIELVTLEKLIHEFDKMLGKNLIEPKWQKFFNENSFILNMAFGYPAIKIRDQASVGGRKLSGEGEKITDFLVKNSLTNNTAVFEIKTPQTPLLNRKPIRNGVYTPSSNLSGSVNQILDQKYQFQRQVTQIKENSRLYNLESYSVHCCLVIGKMPESDDQQKSFELFRGNSKDVEIVTFDELLEKLRQLVQFLRNAEQEKVG